MDNILKIILSRGAEGGALLGAIFVVIFAALVTSANILLSLITLILIVAVPFIAGRLIRKSYVDSAGTLTFSALWLEGIIMFICGSLILTVAVYIFMRWISPDFIVNQLNLLAEIISTDPEHAEVADTIHQMIDKHSLPRPIDFAMSFMWTSAFLGSILSLILAAISVAIPIPHDKYPGSGSHNNISRP